MSDKEVFMHVEQLGDLYMYDVLLSYIYPRVFVCEDIYGCKYLFYEMNSEDNKDTWLVSKITKREYYNLVDKKKPIQKVYEKKTGFELFSISKSYGETDTIELRLDGKEWIKRLPEIDVFAENSSTDDIATETLREARETGSTTFDIRLFAGTDRHSIPQSIMSDLCGKVTALVGSVFGNVRRNDQLRVATAPGSCIVRFSFPDQINLFNESNAINEMKVLNDALTTDSLSESLKFVKDQKKFIRSYSGLLDTIRKTNSDVQFTTASPNSTDVRKVELSKSSVISRYEDVKDLFTLETEEHSFIGSLIALDIKSKKFKLQTQQGIISGGVDEKILTDASYEIPKDYIARVVVEKYLNEQKTSTKEKYRLIALN